ncbi:MAG: flagellar basal body P-ring protein FlgI [Deltaproteobacteria bacterium]|nr:flagellar basal body P-ring protein FlgI [Deltaproteobacteria bacterium]
MGVATRSKSGSLLVAAVLLAVVVAVPAEAARIKDIADVEGVRTNQLSGYGVVVGLEGTGDGQQSLFTVQSILSMLRRRGVTISVDPRQIRVKNAAAVVVTATLPPFAHSGNRIDVQLSSIGDAKSLRGGTLVSTPLLGADQLVYAVAQGAVSLGGGFSAQAAGASATSGHPTVGVVTGGAIVEREVPVTLGADGIVRLSLHEADVTTATRVATAVNASLGDGAAQAVDPATIEVHLLDHERAMTLLPAIESLEVAPDRRAKVIVNERTGTVIMGEEVHIAPVAIAHGSLQIQVKTDLGVSQPAPFSNGQTVVVPDSTINVEEGKAQRLALLRGAVNLGQLVGGLNALGVTPQDLIAVLQAIKAAGALDAELELM